MRKAVCLTLCLMLLGLCACQKPFNLPDPTPTPNQEPTQEAPPVPAFTPAPKPTLAPTPTPEPLDQVTEMELTMELNLPNAPYAGIYTGEMLDGVPHGQGSFSTHNATGQEWIYTGEWSTGHMEGEGEMVWKDIGQKYLGAFQNDMRSGPGQMYMYYVLLYDGVFEKDVIASGKMYDQSESLYYDGAFKEGLRLENEAAVQARLAAYEQEAVPYTAELYDEGLYNHLGKLLVFECTVNEVLAVREDREGLELYTDMGGGLVVSSKVSYRFAYGEAPHAAGQKLRVFCRIHDSSQIAGAGPNAVGMQALAIEILS